MSDTQLLERFGKVETSIGKALEAVEADGGASPVLVAVVREFEKKAAKARPAVSGDDADARYEAVVELEQAGDSAKAAAEADPGISDQTREAVVSAHDRICVMKTRWGS